MSQYELSRQNHSKFVLSWTSSGLCLFLNPKLGCVICQGEFPCVCPKLGISLPSPIHPRISLWRAFYLKNHKLSNSCRRANLCHVLHFWAGVPGLPYLTLSHNASFDRQEVTVPETGCCLSFMKLQRASDQRAILLTPANETIWEGKGQLRASLLPSVVSRSHISAGWFYRHSRNSPLTPYTNPLQVTSPRLHSGMDCSRN